MIFPLTWGRLRDSLIFGFTVCSAFVGLHAEDTSHSQESLPPDPYAAGAPLPFNEFAPTYAMPPSAVFTAPRYFTLRVGYARLPEKIEGLDEMVEVDMPPEIFRDHLIWLDVRARLFQKNLNQESQYITRSPDGESLPRPHHQGKWAYLLPLRADSESVLCTIYFHHSQVVGWDYFLNLPHGAKLDQTTFHEEIELPINQWLILPESAIEHNDTTRRAGSHLYHLLYLSER